MMSMELQAVFIDRDGTIGGSEEVKYPGEFTLFPYTYESIYRLKKAGIYLLQISNRSLKKFHYLVIFNGVLNQ
jgi:histidinol phosphatase-like enzyme